MKISRETVVTIYVLIIIFFLSMAWVHKSHGAEFPAYQYVELSDLSDHPDKYHDEEIQIRGSIHRIDQYIGAYGGEYIGLTMNDGITIFFYAKTGVAMLVNGDTVLVDGTFHKYGKFGGQGHDFFITTHRLERLQ
jgi:hypothetical protein